MRSVIAAICPTSGAIRPASVMRSSSPKAFPDTLVTIDFQVAEDDMVVNRWHFEGTHTGPGYGDPTGRHVSVDGVHIHRIRNGKIVEIWAHGDNATFMRHLGLIPAE